MARRCGTLLLLLLLPAAAGCALPPPPSPASVLAPAGSGAARRPYRKVAVLPFPPGSEYPSAAAEWVAHRLAEGGRLEVVPPGRAELLLRDAAFSWPSPDPPRESWRRAATILGAEAVVSGAVFRDGGPWVRFRAVLRVVDGATGDVVLRDDTTGDATFGFSEYPFWVAAADRAGVRLRERLAGEGASPPAAPAVREGGR